MDSISMQGPGDDDFVAQASAQAVEGAVRGLDGEDRTLMLLELDDDRQLAVAGGAGQYVVYFTPDNLDFWNLIRPGADERKIELVCAGQPGEFEARFVVDLEPALAAARHFHGTGERRPDLSWERQGTGDP